MAAGRVRELRLDQILPEPPKAKVIGGGRLVEGVASLDHVDGNVVHGPCRVYDPEGNVVLIALPLGGTGKLREALQRIKYSKTSRTQGLVSRSRTFGYAPRIPVRGHEACRAAKLTSEDPAAARLLERAAGGVERIYKRELPEEYAAHRAEVFERVLPDWRIGETVFTSGIINLDTALHYHRDAGNFKGRWSVMLTFKHDVVEGGELVFPQWGLAHGTDDGLLMIFHGQRWWHGVTPMQLRRGGFRITTVFYSLEQLWQCLSPAEELARARKKRTERENTKTREIQDRRQTSQ